MHQNNDQSRIATMNRIKLFSDHSESRVTATLSPRVFLSLSHTRDKAHKGKLYLYSLLSSVSLISSAATLFILDRSFAANGFYDFVVLLFSDTGVTFNYMREITLALIQSLPLVALLSVLITCAALIFSSRKVFQYAFGDKNLNYKYV